MSMIFNNIIAQKVRQWISTESIRYRVSELQEALRKPCQRLVGYRTKVTSVMPCLTFDDVYCIIS